MGVPAFYRWLSEKYPKIVQDVLEERVQVVPGGTTRLPFDATRPNPSGLECDHLYIDMNGIIHPCSHPEVGPQPRTEEEMYLNVTMYVDRLVRVFRPRQLLYLAIDGVAPRAKMNQQRSRRFRSAQEARELLLLEQQVRIDIQEETGGGDSEAAVRPSQHQKPAAWDSNVITPGTPFMLNLATYIRFYIRKRVAEDKAWANLRIIFSDASIPGEGEHKIMRHIRLQRAQPGYNPNLVHILHGLDADLIMLALATHEMQFYIAREEVLFGRQSQEQQEERQQRSGFRDAQRKFDEDAGHEAMTLIENNQKPLQRIAIPILREYLANEFASCITPGRTILPFEPNLERLIDDIVFLCFFVGNDFLPHLPSLDIRDGALDFLFNIYKRLLPTFGDYITKSGGNVNLSYVDIILTEVGAIEDFVFNMKHENEERERKRREEMKARNKKQNTNAPPPPPPPPPPQINSMDDTAAASSAKVMGRAARILAKQQERDNGNPVALSKKSSSSISAISPIQASHMKTEQNFAAAVALKEALGGAITVSLSSNAVPTKARGNESDDNKVVASNSGVKRKSRDEDITPSEEIVPPTTSPKQTDSSADPNYQFDADVDDDDDNAEVDIPEVEAVIDEVVDPEIARLFKERVKKEQQMKLDEHVKTVEDKVRLHESGWKDRYYTDKCKADDVANHGGREHLFRSYVMGLCWVMKYYYDGCPSWKWYFPFHYAPFASDLKNIERFDLDCKSFELNAPFNPVEQLMAVLPSDSSHAIPKESRWLMEDPESPIIDFYPMEVPVDPNGKAMPWLWVVLLPFIDEERLLAAMSPTMAKWEKTELLCNARGLDDGYLFVHKKNPLTKKLAVVIQVDKTKYTLKVKLTDAAQYGCPGFNGSIRAPLSNEIYPIDEESIVLPPNGADKIDRGGCNIFSDQIEPNEAVCVAFTEPPKLSHRSIILPGAQVPEPVLTADDKRIRRPKLNRGGGSIAHMGMGMSNGQSAQKGYGSMNIGSYERNLAQQNGRGNDMYQTGNRPWGAMEPLSKRPYGVPPPPPPPPPQQGTYQNQQLPSYQVGQSYQTGRPYAGVSPPPALHQYDQAQQYPPGYQVHYQPPYQAQSGQPMMHANSGQQGPPYQGNNRGNNFQQGQQPYNPNYSFNQAPPQQQGYNFRSFNQAGPGTLPPQQPPERRSRASADVMSSLRAQLTNTLNQKKNGNQTNTSNPR